MSLVSRFLCWFALAFALNAAAAEPDRRIAVTIDDLPWQGIGNTPEDQLQARHAALIAQLKLAGVPITGFVNEGKLEVDGEQQPSRVVMLRDWLEAGFELGNHTHGHLDLHEIGLEAYEQDILQGERVLRPLLAEYGSAPRWFRHPYLRAGRTPEDRATLSAFLHDHGYRIAPVTVDNSEWIWAFAYVRVLDGQADVPDREAVLERLRHGYIPYMLNKIDYYEQQSQALLGYALPQVWLMHANELNAATFAELIAAVQRRGYRIVTLEDALRDPAYRRGEDGYNGRYGPSWLHRWAMAENKPREFYAGEPTVPQWVLDLAGVASE
ncbi:polysaccharide deacetylase [Pseudoxanthomonas kalamensis DSM 18571]|uniref:polysaccharide deacetylase family protein n=1 Tax=Pseudoxanthomonas kalamensis TaxID=289483 RepID=UPI0013915886|nr:polysaccharide deacetylase family protein [Pseudoxanthomonas kalamensis]KAF1709376.1 polysaccharide deacetylase [Pseudoxanthomonas kalamensis DSM 18571]